MRLAWLAIAVVGCAGSSTGAGGAASRPAPRASKAEILDVMDRYLATPFEGDGERPTKIVDFVTKSEDVEVVLSAPALPFLQERLDDGVTQLLLAGFFAGDARAQLRAGKCADDIHAGVAGELAIYGALKARADAPALKGVKLISPGLDALIDCRPTVSWARPLRRRAQAQGRRRREVVTQLVIEYLGRSSRRGRARRRQRRFRAQPADGSLLCWAGIRRTWCSRPAA